MMVYGIDVATACMPVWEVLVPANTNDTLTRYSAQLQPSHPQVLTSLNTGVAVECLPEPTFWSAAKSCATTTTASGTTASASTSAIAQLQSLLMQSLVEGVDVSCAQATVASDKEMILGMIREAMGLDQFNEEIKGRLKATALELLLQVGGWALEWQCGVFWRVHILGGGAGLTYCMYACGQLYAGGYFWACIQQGAELSWTPVLGTMTVSRYVSMWLCTCHLFDD